MADISLRQQTKNLLFLLIALPFIGISQDSIIIPKVKYDISLTFCDLVSKGNPKFEIEFRNQIDERNWLKASLGNYKESTWYNETLPKTHDSIIETRGLYDSYRSYYIQFGLDKTLGKRALFSFGLNAILGHQLREQSYSTSGKSWNPIENKWVSTLYLDGEPSELGLNDGVWFFDNTRNGHFTSQYITTGLEFNLGVHAPITNRIQIGLQYAPQLIFGFKVAEDNEILVDDVLNNYSKSSRVYYHVDLSLRYKLGRYK